MDDRPRKDRLIQTRVPQDLESTLKDEARKRRLSVSHLIRNVLEDTFSLVDNVVTEVDRVVTDSVEMAQTLKRDAQRLAATARGHTSHRERPSTPERASAHGRTREPEIEEAEVSEPPAQPATASPAPVQAAEPANTGLSSPQLADVYGFQELVLNRAAICANCGTTIARGTRAHLGMTDKADQPRAWICQSCLDLISG
jgi:hypothetical protein